MKNQMYSKKIGMSYIGLCCVIFAIIYLPIVTNDNMYMYIDIGADTYCSYWPSIAYAKSLLQEMKLWDFNLGLGSSTVNYISYFLLDPFNWICFLFNTYDMTVGIYLSLILKNIVLAYYSYRYISIKNIQGLSRIVAALSILFCGWFVGWGQHYNYATIFVFFVMILYYFEIWLQKAQFVRLVLSLGLLTLNSPYYCYMVLMFLAIYYLVYLWNNICLKKINLKDAFFHAIKTAGVVFWGIALAAVIFIPFMKDMLQSPRVGGKIVPSFQLGTWTEYLSMILRMFSNSIMGINQNFAGYHNFYECPFMYVGIIFIFSLSVFIHNKDFRKRYKISIGLIFAAILFVNVSSVVFNAFSTKGYRWTFVLVPLFAIVLGQTFNSLVLDNNRKLLCLVSFCGNLGLFFYGVWYVEKYDLNEEVVSSLLTAFLIWNLYVLVINLIDNTKLKRQFLLIIFSLELALNGYYCVNRMGILSNESKETMEYFDASNAAIKYLEEIDDSFYRISKKYANIDLNDNQIQHYRGEKIYSSILTGEMWDFIDFFDMRIPGSNYFYGFEDKQVLRNISSGKYRFSKSDNEYYGHKFIKKDENLNIYENLNCFGFGNFYDDFMLRSEADKLNTYEKQDVLFSAVILEDEEVRDKELNLNQLTAKESCDWLTSSKDIKLNQICLDGEIRLETELNMAPLIICINGKNLSGTINYFTKGNTEIAEENSIIFTGINGEKIYYIDTLQIDSMVISDIQGELLSIDIRELDATELNAKNMNRLEQVLNISSFKDTEITASSNNTAEKILMLPIPYNSNWKVYVNGIETYVYHANCAYMAVIVPDGACNIEMKYISKSFYVGMGISLFSMCILLGNCCLRKMMNGREYEKKANLKYTV